MTINESIFIEYARKHNLEFAKDPYHASKGFELRRYGNVVESVGFLFGQNSVEVYQRISSRAVDLIHRRLWFIEPILTAFVAGKRDNYRVLHKLPLEGFSEIEALAILKLYFGS